MLVDHFKLTTLTLNLKPKTLVLGLFKNILEIILLLAEVLSLMLVVRASGKTVRKAPK